MMPEYKLVRLLAVLSSILVLSGCSRLNFLNIDAVDDNVDYQKTARSVKALAIPPGLSDPGFDDTYASDQIQSSAVSRQRNVESGSVGSVQSNSILASSASRPAPVTPSSKPAPVTPSSTPTPVTPSSMPSPSGSGRGISLGAALLEQSAAVSPVQQKPAARVTSTPRAQVQQAPVPQTPKPTAVARTSNYPQVAMMRLKSGEPALAVNAPYAKTWSSLAPVIPAIGFQVTKKQSDQGIYTAQYKGKASANLEPGKTYLVLVAENASRQSFIGVANDNGKPASDAVANEVLNRLKAEFER